MALLDSLESHKSWPHSADSPSVVSLISLSIRPPIFMKFPGTKLLFLYNLWNSFESPYRTNKQSECISKRTWGKGTHIFYLNRNTSQLKYHRACHSHEYERALSRKTKGHSFSSVSPLDVSHGTPVRRSAQPRWAADTTATSVLIWTGQCSTRHARPELPPFLLTVNLWGMCGCQQKQGEWIQAKPRHWEGHGDYWRAFKGA